MNYIEVRGAPEIFSDVARGTRDGIRWPLASTPKGIVILYPEFLVFVTDDERSPTKRLLSFSVAGVAARLIPFFDRLGGLARALGLASFDRAKAMENPQSFFIPRREITSVRPLWRATHGGIVHLRTREGKDFYIYQDMHSTTTWSYFVRGGWRWHKRLAEALMRPS